MFAYNELSDLINGELVTPLREGGENIRRSSIFF